MEKSTASPICNLGARWMWVASFMPQPLHPQVPQHRRLGAHPDEECVLRSSKTPMKVGLQDFNPLILIVCTFDGCFQPIKRDHEADMSAAHNPLLLNIRTVKFCLPRVKLNTFIVYRIRVSFNNLIHFMLTKSVQLALQIKLHALWGSDAFITGISQVLET